MKKRDQYDYEAAKKHIMLKFPKPSDISFQQKFYNAQQTESNTVLSFGLRLQKYYLKAFKAAGNEAELIKKFLNGLSPDFKKDLVAYAAKNFDDTLQIACK